MLSWLLLSTIGRRSHGTGHLLKHQVSDCTCEHRNYTEEVDHIAAYRDSYEEYLETSSKEIESLKG